MRDYTISQLAKEANVNIETIRYYERLGLMRQPLRSGNGYRHYDDSAVTQLQFIRHVQTLGFTLKEIKQLLRLRNDNKVDSSSMRSLTEKKLADIRQRLSELHTIEKQLQHYIDSLDASQDDTTSPSLETLWPDDTAGDSEPVSI